MVVCVEADTIDVAKISYQDRVRGIPVLGNCSSTYASQGMVCDRYEKKTNHPITSSECSGAKRDRRWQLLSYFRGDLSESPAGRPRRTNSSAAL